MANPQKENGYTQISNEILEAVARFKLNGTQLRILLIIWRKSYGYRKSECEISLTYLSKAVGSTKNAVSREMSKLKALNIISEIEQPGKHQSKVYKFHKNYEDWGKEIVTNLNDKGLSNQITDNLETERQKVTESDNRGVTELGNEGLSNPVTEGYRIRQQGVTKSDNKRLPNQITNKEIYKENIKENDKEKCGSAHAGDFENVILSKKDYEKAVSEMGKQFADRYIDKLSCHMAATGKTYQNHLAVLMKWFHEDKLSGKIQVPKKSRYNYDEFERRTFFNLHKDKFTEPEGAED